ncbi:unnamed protein product [Sphagnum jensenii]
MQSLLERVEMNMTKRDSQAGNMEVEVNEWHCQVIKLLFQLEIVDTSSSMEAIQSDWLEFGVWNCGYRLCFQTDNYESDSAGNCLCGQSACSVPGQEMEGVIPVMSRAVKEQKEKIDLSRWQYLAATIAAPELPSEELLTLVGELWKQLEAFLIRALINECYFCEKTMLTEPILYGIAKTSPCSSHHVYIPFYLLAPVINTGANGTAAYES